MIKKKKKLRNQTCLMEVNEREKMSIFNFWIVHGGLSIYSRDQSRQ